MAKFPSVLTNGFAVKKVEWLTLEEFTQKHQQTQNAEYTWCLPFECTVWDCLSSSYIVYWDDQKLGEIKSNYLGDGQYAYVTPSGTFHRLAAAVASFFGV